MAHFETVDRENELIQIGAIERALPQYMKHPILHHQHTERPIGTVTKAFITDKAFHLEAAIYDTSDTDDVWSEIVSGKLNKFSIFGRRESGSSECKLPPVARSSPCVTKALTLFSISVVGDNAMNQSTFLEVIKAYIEKKGDDMEPDDEKKEEEVEEKADEETPELMTDPRNPSEMQKSIDDYGGRLSKIEETLTQLVESDKKVHDTMDKAEEEDKDMEDKKEEVEKCNDMKKGEEVVETTETPEYITKAALDDITKAYIEKFDLIQKGYDDLKGRVEKMEKETIEKGGNIVIINKGASNGEDAMLKQLDRIGDVI